MDENFSALLLEWYYQHKRDLPWRENQDPYRIWVSEIMLQQTQVDTVIPYYHRFMARFPTIEQLAAAKEEEVLKHWEGLGYYSRARYLQRAAREVRDRYRGQFPDVKSEVLGLPGIGPYTTGAILSIAYNQTEPAVDGNVMRVLARYFFVQEDIALLATRTKMEKLARSLIPVGKAGDFNQALMEFGALLCTPKTPTCSCCPVRQGCLALQHDKVSFLPFKTKAKKPKVIYRYAVIIEGKAECAGKVLVRKRPEQGLLAQMWEIPHVALSDASSWEKTGQGMAQLKEELKEDHVQAHLSEEIIMTANHIFTHQIWKLKVFRGTQQLTHNMRKKEEGTNLYQWIDANEFENYSWAQVFRKILQKYFTI